MLVPFADCANHHAADNIFEMFNSRISKAFKEGREDELESYERHYMTVDKKKLNFEKHFDEKPIEEENPKETKLSYKSMQYAKRIEMRQKIQSITGHQFVIDDEFEDQDVWQVRYVSTSDEDDDDSDMEQSSDEEEEGEEEMEENDSENSAENNSTQDKTESKLEKQEKNEVNFNENQDNG